MVKKIINYFNNTIDKANVDNILFIISEELKGIKELNKDKQEEITLIINKIEKDIKQFRLKNNIGYYE